MNLKFWISVFLGATLTASESSGESNNTTTPKTLVQTDTKVEETQHDGSHYHGHQYHHHQVFS